MPEHAHDWPLLSLFVMGAYSNETESGKTFIDGPSAILYAAGAAHRNTVGSDGFEQIEIEFDPAWLSSSRLPDNRVYQWIGGRGGTEARALAGLVSQNISEERLRVALQQFLQIAPCDARVHWPAWLGNVSRRLKSDPSINVGRLAQQAGVHPSWLGTAYKVAVGERLVKSAARFRIEHAARLLRETDLPLAWVASESGFCDHSHMVRTFRRMLGRPPSRVREEGAYARQL